MLEEKFKGVLESTWVVEPDDDDLGESRNAGIPIHLDLKRTADIHFAETKQKMDIYITRFTSLCKIFT